MLLQNSIAQLGAVVLDEMHMIGDPQRGYIMELLVTKILALQMPIQVLTGLPNTDDRLLECRRR